MMPRFLIWADGIKLMSWGMNMLTLRFLGVI